MSNLGTLIESRLNRIDARNRELDSRAPLWTPHETEVRLSRAQSLQRRVMRSGDLAGYLKQRFEREKARARKDGAN